MANPGGRLKILGTATRVPTISGFPRMDDPPDDSFLRLLRAAWSPEPAAGLPNLDGQELARRALSEGVGPLLYGRLRGRGILPPEAEEALRRAYYATAARNARLLSELETILHALAPTPVLLLKGAALALAVYENPALRPMGDIDLLVRPGDVDAALEALAGLGYRPLQHEPAPDSTRTFENQVLLGKEGGTAPLEVHWGLFDSPYYQEHLPMDWFWQTAIPLTAGTMPLRALGPAAQLLHLCAHLVLHHGAGSPRLLWLHDVAEVLARYQGAIDWPSLLSQARASELVGSLRRVLPRVAREWQAPIPAPILGELAALQPSPAEARILARLASGPRPAGRRLLDDLADTPTWHRRLRLAWVNLFPTAAYMQQRYRIRHRFLVPFLYPYRWFLGLRGLASHRQPCSGP